MTNRVYIDFESRSQADIWSIGAWNYAIHPTTEILCLCYALNDGPVVRISFAHGHMKNTFYELNKYVQLGYEFHAHNAFFERCIWRHILVPKYGALPIPINQWRCTAAKANASALPRSLENCAKALMTKNQKDMSGSRLMKRLSSSIGYIDPGDLNGLIEYCVQDVLAEREIDQRLPDLPPYEQKMWFLDQHINDTGVSVDIDAVKKALVVIKNESDVLTKELQTLTDGAIEAGTQAVAIRNWLETRGLKLDNLNKNTVKEALKNSDPKFTRVLQLRQQLSLSSNAKYEAMTTFTSPDGKCRDTLVYHGASTGRWTGKAVQIHNLPKPTTENFDNLTPIKILKSNPDAFSLIYDGEVLNTLSSCIRGMFVPSPGHEMFITDFAAIEARVVMWAAGEEKGVKLFSDQDTNPGESDIYVEMAKQIFNKKELTKKDKRERQLGKQSVLGAGFGMGPDRFRATCEQYQIQITAELAYKAVHDYRNMFKKVVQFWYSMEETAKKAVFDGKYSYQCGKVLWYMEGEFLRMKLPSGRTLAYHHPKIQDDKISFLAVNSLTKKYQPETVWGGTLVENAVQAIARDIMASAMMNCALQGYRVLFTVHDELVLEKAVGAGSCEEVLQIVRQVPSWAAGCPINAECEKAERYRK